MSHINCPDCKDSIVSRTVSKIGTTQCTENCPEDITCPDIRPSNCAFYSGSNLSCSGINFGDSVTLAFAKVDAQLCSNQTNNCLFKISSDDTCCGHFESKVLAGTGIVFTTNNAGTCETLTVSSACNTWTSITPSSASATGAFRNKWRNASGFIAYQVAQYSNTISCIVRLRGTVTNQLDGSCNSSIILKLPVAPLFTRVYSVNLLQVVNGCSRFSPSWVTIASNGEVTLVGSGVNGVVSLSLDGISFEVS